jgi:predicted GIY-YIG superfamily endonuclease
MEEKRFYVYILAKGCNSTFYTGVTSELPQRVWKMRIIEQMNPGWEDLYERICS